MSTEITRVSSITEILPRITANYRPYVQAVDSKNIKECTKLEAVTFIIGAFNKASMVKGQVSDARADRFIGEGLYDEFIRKAPHARLGEIELAFKNGALGEYTKRDDRGRVEFEGINVNTLWGFWKSYASSNEVLEAKKEMHRVQDLQMFDKPALKVDYTESIKRAYQDYLVTGEVPFNKVSSDFYMYICDAKKQKTMIMDKELRTLIREQAMKEYRGGLIEKKYHKKQPREFEVLLDSCFKGVNATYDSISRKLALKYYFEICKSNGTLPI